jgi:hypothetical protein
VWAEKRGLNPNRVPAVDVFGRIVTNQDDHVPLKIPFEA